VTNLNTNLITTGYSKRMTTRKTTTAPKQAEVDDDYRTKAIVAAILIHKGTPVKASMENADWIVESLKNESVRSK
jgi:hypothetical protein